MCSYRCKLGCLLLLIGVVGSIALPASAQTYFDFSKPQKGPFPHFIDLSGEGSASEQSNMTNPEGSIFDAAMKGNSALVEKLIKGGVATNSRGEGNEASIRLGCRSVGTCHYDDNSRSGISHAGQRARLS